MNHSDKANCEFKRVMLGGLLRVLCCAVRDVDEGEELTLDYGRSYWRVRGGLLKSE